MQSLPSTHADQSFKPKYWILSFLALGILWLLALGFRHLLPSDEGRYAEIAREMLATGDWLTPKYNGYQYFEKPPLQMWATALAFKLFGLGEWQARLWSGLTSLLSIYMLIYTASKLYTPRLGFVSGLILLSSPLWFMAGHFNSLDMGVASLMWCSLCGLMLAQHAPKSSTPEASWMLFCWGSMALAVLSKGLIGIVLPGIVLFVYSVTSWDWHAWRRMHWIKGLLLFFSICTPWFWMMSKTHPAFFDFFFIHEHFERFTSNEHDRVGSWHFFIPLILVGLLPWLPQLFFGLLAAFKNRTLISNEEKPATQFKSLWMCLIWALTIFIFFSLSHSKLPGYILPIFPSLALLSGVGIEKIYRQVNINKRFSPWGLQVLFFITFFVIGYFALPQVAQTGEVYEKTTYVLYAKWIGVALTLGLIGMLVSWIYRKQFVTSIIIYALSFLGVSAIAGIGHESVGRLLSGFDVAMKAKPFVNYNQPLYSVILLEHTIPFYLEKNTTLVSFEDELAFGIKQEPHLWIPSVDEFLSIWNDPKSSGALAMMIPQTYETFKEKHVPMKLIAQDSLRVIVQKPN